MGDRLPSSPCFQRNSSGPVPKPASRQIDMIDATGDWVVEHGGVGEEFSEVGERKLIYPL